MKKNIQYPHKCSSCPKILNSEKQENKHLRTHINKKKMKGGKNKTW